LSTMNFNGGTLRANASSNAFLPAFTGLTANVQGGGARIDTSGFDITISQPLIHDAATPIDGGLVKGGIGALTLGGDHTYNGPTQVTGGSLVLSGSLSGTAVVSAVDGTVILTAANRINDAAAITLGTAGVFNTGGFNEVIGAITLSGDATIDVGAGASVLKFANSAAATWGPAILTISGWNGSPNGLGQDEIFFGTSASGLTAAQVAQIRFLDPAGLSPGLYQATMLNTGELVAVPEPGSVALLLVGMGLLFTRQRRRE
jgi:autotransporter-associated beta strand protein